MQKKEPTAASQAVAKRVAELIKLRYHNRNSWLAKALGEPASTVNNWLFKKNGAPPAHTITPSKIDHICRVTGVSKEWLLTGEGAMFDSPAPPGISDRACIVNTADDIKDRLKALRELLTEGYINEAEHEAKRKELIDRL